MHSFTLFCDFLFKVYKNGTKNAAIGQDQNEIQGWDMSNDLFLIGRNVS